MDNYQTTMNTNINFATATYAELAAAGYKIDVRRSQATRRRRSAFGVKPRINNAHGYKVNKLANAVEEGRGTIN
jgi:hypothetical protein